MLCRAYGQRGSLRRFFLNNLLDRKRANAYSLFLFSYYKSSCYGEVSESAEGARLLSEYTVLSCIEGSNPSLSAKQAFNEVQESPQSLEPSGLFLFLESVRFRKNP